MNGFRLVLATFVSVCVFLAGAVVSYADDSAPGGNLTVSGSVALSDGAPAANAFVESPGTNATPTLRTRADDQGRYRLEGHFGFGCQLHVRSADETQQATFMISAAAARTRLVKPVDFQLTPAKPLVITVTSAAGAPVAGAHVAAEGEAYRVRGLSSDDGKATLLLPAEGGLRSVVAWHPTGAAGQADYQRGLQRDAFQLALSPTAPHKICVVDSDEQPVADLLLGPSIRTTSNKWITTADVDAARLRTDARGEVTATWFPQDIAFVNTRIPGHEWKADEIEIDQATHAVSTLHLRHKVRVSGRLKMPGGASAAGISVSAFGFGPKNNGDIPTARAAADGTFMLWVAPDHGYALNINDTQWASDGWSGLILANEKATPAEIVMELYPATPLEVRVTRGDGHVGVAGASASLRSEQHFSWRNAKGASRNAVGGRNDWTHTDADGIGRLALGHGKQKLFLRSGDWEEERTITVDSASPMSVEFYRPWLAQRKITGRLLADGTGQPADRAGYKPSPIAKIEAAALGQPHRRFAIKSSLDPDGTFAVEGDASELSIFAIDREHRVSGFARVGLSDATIDLTMRPMAHYAGVFVDPDKQPHATKTLRIVVKDTDHLAAEDQVTDDEGNFEFPLVAADVPLALQVQQASPNASYFRQIGELLFKPGEKRDDVRVAVDLRDPSQRRLHPEVTVPLSERLALAVRNARLGGMHVLAVLQGDSTDKVLRLAEALSEYEEQPAVLSYVTLFLDEKALQANATTLKELAWPLPQPGEVVLVAIDGDGKQLGAERLKIGDAPAASKLATALLKKNLPPTRDAQARFDAARDEAQRSGKKLWIVEGGPRCGPCFRLSRWMDDQHALLEKDYVIVKVMGGLDTHAADVIKPLSRPPSGIPWFAITDTSGTVLTTSESPLGNIGMPTSLEDIRYFRDMLARTSQHLTPEDLDRLANSLKGFK